MNKQLLAASLVLLLGVQLGLVAYFAGWFESRSAAPEAVRKEDKPRPGPPSAAEQRKELPAFFDTLGAALGAGNTDAAAVLHDRERWLDEVEAVVRSDKQPLPQRFRQRLMQTQTIDRQPFSFTRRALMRGWDQSEIGKLLELARPGEVQVFVNHRLGGGPHYHMCWWLKYGPAGWRFFDWEDRELNERFSRGIGLAARQNLEQGGPWLQAATALRQGEEASLRENFAVAATILPRIAAVKFPPLLEAHRWLLAALVALDQGKWAEALEHFDRADRCRGPIPYVDRLRVRVYIHQLEWGRALAALNRYTERLGEDPTTHNDRGIALGRLGLLPSALASFRKSLEDFPPQN